MVHTVFLVTMTLKLIEMFRRMLEHKEAIISHLSWVSFILSSTL
jgi:hypothetical protein